MIPPPHADAFLDRAGWTGAAVLPLAGDASFRRYFRVVRDGETAVLMDAPPPHEDPRPFIAIARWLQERGFAAPRILSEDLPGGLVLIEDFGDALMRAVVEDSEAEEERVYAAAVDLLVELRSAGVADVPVYDRAVYQREAALLPEWYCPAVGIESDPAGYAAAWDAVLPLVLNPAPVVTVLRDYHAENIMLTGGGSALGLLDFQDALAGHAAYDLVSLLQDARREVRPELEARMLARYKAATGEGDAFDAAYHVLGAQRNAKIIGIFTRLWQRDGKPRYPTLCPRVWAYLERDLAHPALAPVAAWFDRVIPPALRGDPIVIAGA
ncbi:phosphotransferase [Sphingomonas sp. BGYR3]|uniref:aminoglycoside phosphotransferase family protein n=1 Tax=Sphingomonas sp. BGYR3 TaxID=2975483 RepID=UPI0021A3908A|nr:phosphotransferase [Sphingomonas sp. BGYR3]MDG5487303.1 phosphotransferase [Sphingomonas sp. BGYR3]